MHSNENALKRNFYTVEAFTVRIALCIYLLLYFFFFCTIKIVRSTHRKPILQRNGEQANSYARKKNDFFFLEESFRIRHSITLIHSKSLHHFVYFTSRYTRCFSRTCTVRVFFFTLHFSQHTIITTTDTLRRASTKMKWNLLQIHAHTSRCVTYTSTHAHTHTRTHRRGHTDADTRIFASNGEYGLR